MKSKTIFKKTGNNLVVPSWTAIVKETTRKVGEKVPNRIITCSNCRHGMGVPNGNPIWRCDWGAEFGARSEEYCQWEFGTEKANQARNYLAEISTCLTASFLRRCRSLYLCVSGRTKCYSCRVRSVPSWVVRSWPLQRWFPPLFPPNSLSQLSQWHRVPTKMFSYVNSDLSRIDNKG